MKKCIILANGKPPKKKIINFFIRKGYQSIICADGGANSARKLNLTPDYIIGDLDSVTAITLNEFKTVSKIVKIRRQNDTDVEKCLKFAIKSGYEEVLLTGVIGNRLDHTFCNLGIVLKYFNEIKMSLVSENSFLKPYTKKVKLRTITGETISIYGINSKTKITSKGLKYPLKNNSLPFGKKESTSNVAIGTEIELRIGGGIIFAIRDVNQMIKNDLF